MSRKKTVTPNTPGTELAFWNEADYRCSVWKKVRRLNQELLDHTGADSIQKRLACKRLTFVCIMLESLEKRQIESGTLDNFESGQYIALCNSMTGLLRVLGLEKRVKALNLQEYLKQASVKAEGA